MRASKPSCTGVVSTAIPHHVRSCDVSHFILKPHFADDIINDRRAPLARQELRLYVTLRGDDHGGAAALAGLRHVFHSLATHCSACPGLVHESH